MEGEVHIKEATPKLWMWLKCSCGKSLNQKLYAGGTDDDLCVMELLVSFLRDHAACEVED